MSSLATTFLPVAAVSGTLVSTWSVAVSRAMRGVALLRTSSISKSAQDMTRPPALPSEEEGDGPATSVIALREGSARDIFCPLHPARLKRLT